MKTAERVVIFVVVAIVLFALHQLTTSLFNAHGWKGMEASDWASWVQAVGSIAAIYGAFQISNKQHLRERRLQEEKEQHDTERRYRIIGGILRRIGARLKAVERSRDKSVILVADERYIEKLRATAVLLDALPSFEMPGPKILILCLSIRGHIADTADALLEERRSRLNLQPTAARTPSVDEQIESLSYVLNLGIKVCANSASRLR